MGNNLSVSIGICCYNEEKNIGTLLDNLLTKQDLPPDSEIIVVCSGCTDSTPKIVRDFSERNHQVKLICEDERYGKATALNKIFREVNSENDFLVLVNADDLPDVGSIKKLLQPFCDKDVGATTGHPIPINSSRGISNRIVHMIWDFHHQICLYKSVKVSMELCAIRPTLNMEILENIVTDEPYIEMLIRRQGYRIVYVPEAVVKMKGPDNLRELLNQRRRNCVGHRQIMEKTGYIVSTYGHKEILSIVWESLKKRPSPTYFLTILVGVILEISARFLALYDVRRGKIPYVWERLGSTKNLSSESD